jgi:hypothetical protein
LLDLIVTLQLGRGACRLMGLVRFQVDGLFQEG